MAIRSFETGFVLKADGNTLEPTRDLFDFTTVRNAVAFARAHSMNFKLRILGTYTNTATAVSLSQGIDCSTSGPNGGGVATYNLSSDVWSCIPLIWRAALLYRGFRALAFIVPE